jgi:hypothetical protein
MGMLPPEEEKAPAPQVQARVETAAAATSRSDQQELAEALEELESEQQGGEKKRAGR